MSCVDSVVTDSVETLGVDSRTRVRRLGAKEKARRKKCNVRFSLIKRNKAFQKSYVKVVSRRCYDRYDMDSSCSGDGSHGEVETEETDGSSSRQKEYDFSVPIHGSIWL